MQVGWCGHWNPLLLGGGSARFVLLRSLAVEVREEHTGYQGSTCVNKFVCCESCRKDANLCSCGTIVLGLFGNATVSQQPCLARGFTYHILLNGLTTKDSDYKPQRLVLQPALTY